MGIDFFTFSSFILTTLGYLGVFILSIICNATIFFPLPLDIIIFTSAGFFNPFLLAIISGLGMSIGELTSYYLGKVGEKVLKKRLKRKKSYIKAKALFSKYGFFVIPLFALTPLPFDVIGIICGSLNYDIKKFFLGTLIGKTIRALLLSYAGSYAIPELLLLIKFLGI